MFVDHHVAFADTASEFSIAQHMRLAGVRALVDGSGATHGGRPVVAMYYRPCPLQLHWAGETFECSPPCPWGLYRSA
jgi:predicted O-linked N-acetylglucosamine transferase (SPINDLY family)